MPTSFHSSSHTLFRTAVPPQFTGNWNDPIWAAATPLPIAHFYAVPQASSHQPKVAVRTLHDDAGLYLFFRVEDQFVRSVQTQMNGQVCKDSCVEFFVEPVPGLGYFNLEINAGGVPLCYHITGDLRKKEFVPVAPQWLERLRIRSSEPQVIEPEILTPHTWHLEVFIPFAFFQAHLPAGTELDRSRPWRGNFYKCADATSHPHWASWVPVGTEPFSFHQPDCFAPLHFAQS